MSENYNIENGCIYKTTNLINKKYYIGKNSTNNPDYIGSGVRFSRAVDKYGKDNFLKEIIIENITNINDLNALEKYFIKEYNAVKDPMSYNVADGGQGGNTLAGFTDEERKAHGQKSKDKWKNYSDEKRKEILDKLHYHALYEDRTEEHEKNLKKAIQDFHKSDLGKESHKKRASLIEEYWRTEEGEQQKQKLRELGQLLVGEKNHFFGKHHTVESNQKNREAHLGEKEHTKIRRIKVYKDSLNGMNNVQLAEKYSVTTKTIRCYINKCKSELNIVEGNQNGR